MHDLSLGASRSRIVLLLLAGCTAHAQASELVYTPVNPAFGGSPLNGGWLLSNAQTTNRHKDLEAQSRMSAALTQKTPLQNFNDMLERSILSQLSFAAASKITSSGKLVPGTVETGNFTINIVDAGGGLLVVTTTDKATGASTSFQVGQ
jgi:curli production assembly/transport component CsgF